MLILGSSSKFRSRILTQNNIEHVILKPEIDEKAIGDRNGDPNTLVLAVSHAKLKAIETRLLSPNPPFPLPECKDDVILVCCDQVTCCNGVIREKPRDEEECRAYLRSYSKHPAVTHTAIVIKNLGTGVMREGVDVARQYFSVIPEDVIDALIREGDVMHCSGGFMIDSDLVVPYLKERHGDEDSIIGMPMKLLQKLLTEL